MPSGALHVTIRNHPREARSIVVFVMPVATRGSVAAGSHTGPLLWGAMTTDPASPTPSDATGSLAASSTEVLPETVAPEEAAPVLDSAKDIQTVITDGGTPIREIAGT